MLLSFTDKIDKEFDIELPFVAGDVVQFTNCDNLPETGVVTRSRVLGVVRMFSFPYAQVKVVGADFAFTEVFVPLGEWALSKEDEAALALKDDRTGRWKLQKISK